MAEKAFTDEQSVQVICSLIRSGKIFVENGKEMLGMAVDEKEMSRDVALGLIASQLRELHFLLTHCEDESEA